MSDLKDTQYADSKNFNARIYLHARYGTNRNPFPEWVFDEIDKTPGARVLELGCGNALLWLVNAERIPESWDIILSDFSSGMLSAAEEKTGSLGRKFSCIVIDAENIPCYNNSFDIIIANHMMYHVPDRDRALSEMQRVLKNDGFFYATTMENDYMIEMRDLICEYRKVPVSRHRGGGVIQNFSLSNGAEQLGRHFGSIELRVYKNKLLVTDAGPFTDYVISCNGIIDGRVLLHENEKDNFYGFINDRINMNSGIKFSADAGMFICRNA